MCLATLENSRACIHVHAPFVLFTLPLCFLKDIATNFTFINEHCKAQDAASPLLSIQQRMIELAVSSAVSIKWTHDLRLARKILTRRKIKLEHKNLRDAPIFDDDGKRRDVYMNVNTLLGSDIARVRQTLFNVFCVPNIALSLQNI